MSASGLSAIRLRRLHDVLARHVESGGVPGLVALVARRGEVHVEAIGTTAAGGSEPMRRDTIFRIASVTKQIAAAAAMTLVEECRRDRDVRLHRPGRGADRNPADPAGDDLAAAAERVRRLLDLRLPGHQRLSADRGEAPGPARPAASRTALPRLRLAERPCPGCG